LQWLDGLTMVVVLTGTYRQARKFGISMEFQPDSEQHSEAIEFFGNIIEAGTAQAYFSPVNMALQRVAAFGIFPPEIQCPSLQSITL